MLKLSWLDSWDQDISKKKRQLQLWKQMTFPSSLRDIIMPAVWMDMLRDVKFKPFIARLLLTSQSQSQNRQWLPCRLSDSQLLMLTLHLHQPAMLLSFLKNWAVACVDNCEWRCAPCPLSSVPSSAIASWSWHGSQVKLKNWTGLSRSVFHTNSYQAFMTSCHSHSRIMSSGQPLRAWLPFGSPSVSLSSQPSSWATPGLLQFFPRSVSFA